METGPDLLSYQKKLTGWFVAGYFSLVAAFIALGACLLVFDDAISISEDTRDILQWIMATIGPLIGVLTGAVKDQLQFHFGSSVGSKLKDAQARPTGG